MRPTKLLAAAAAFCLLTACNGDLFVPDPADAACDAPPATFGAARTLSDHRESDMMPETQLHVIARQMFERHGATAIAQAAQNARACESKGDTEQAKEWRHIEDAIKVMRGPHQS